MFDRPRVLKDLIDETQDQLDRERAQLDQRQLEYYKLELARQLLAEHNEQDELAELMPRLQEAQRRMVEAEQLVARTERLMRIYQGAGAPAGAAPPTGTPGGGAPPATG